MKVSGSQVGQCFMFLFGIATGVLLVKPGYFWIGVIVGACAIMGIWADVRWGAWPDDHVGPRFPDGS